MTDDFKKGFAVGMQFNLAVTGEKKIQMAFCELVYNGTSASHSYTAEADGIYLVIAQSAAAKPTCVIEVLTNAKLLIELSEAPSDAHVIHNAYMANAGDSISINMTNTTVSLSRHVALIFRITNSNLHSRIEEIAHLKDNDKWITLSATSKDNEMIIGVSSTVSYGSSAQTNEIIYGSDNIITTCAIPAITNNYTKLVSFVNCTIGFELYAYLCSKCAITFFRVSL